MSVVLSVAAGVRQIAVSMVVEGLKEVGDGQYYVHTTIMLVAADALSRDTSALASHA